MKPSELDDPPPARPIEPAPDACCGEGCAHCVLDLYDAALDKYEADLAAWRARRERSSLPDRNPSGFGDCAGPQDHPQLTGSPR